MLYSKALLAAMLLACAKGYNAEAYVTDAPDYAPEVQSPDYMPDPKYEAPAPEYVEQKYEEPKPEYVPAPQYEEPKYEAPAPQYEDPKYEAPEPEYVPAPAYKEPVYTTTKAAYKEPVYTTTKAAYKEPVYTTTKAAYKEPVTTTKAAYTTTKYEEPVFEYPASWEYEMPPLPSQYPKYKRNKQPKGYGMQVSMYDLGLYQLVAHDAFRVDRGDGHSQVGTQNLQDGMFNGRTWLYDTTVPLHEQKPLNCTGIRGGGTSRNKENFALHWWASEMGKQYCDLMEKNNYSPERAYQANMQTYRKHIRQGYYRLMGRRFPKEWKGDCVAQSVEDLAWRSGHVMLPGQVMVKGVMMDTMSVPRIPSDYTAEELQQMMAKPIDGKFDQRFIEMKGNNNEPFSLLDADHSYGQQFETPEPFQLYLDELDKWGQYRKGLFVTRRIDDFFARSYYCGMRKENYNAPAYPGYVEPVKATSKPASKKPWYYFGH